MLCGNRLFCWCRRSGNKNCGGGWPVVGGRDVLGCLAFDFDRVTYQLSLSERSPSASLPFAAPPLSFSSLLPIQSPHEFILAHLRDLSWFCYADLPEPITTYIREPFFAPCSRSGFSLLNQRGRRPASFPRTAWCGAEHLSNSHWGTNPMSGNQMLIALDSMPDRCVWLRWYRAGSSREGKITGENGSNDSGDSSSSSVAAGITAVVIVIIYGGGDGPAPCGRIASFAEKAWRAAGSARNDVSKRGHLPQERPCGRCLSLRESV